MATQKLLSDSKGTYCCKYDEMVFVFRAYITTLKSYFDKLGFVFVLFENQGSSFLLAKTDTAFKAFLDAQNPRRQHSSTLESYLIKPIQRILKYPLLLKELFSLTDADSEEHYHLDGKGLNNATLLNSVGDFHPSKCKCKPL